jgi:integrase
MSASNYQRITDAGKLTDDAIRALAIQTGISPQTGKPYAYAKATDGHGLYVILTPDGRRRWRVRVKGTDYALGDYPAVSIDAARAAAAEKRGEVKAPPPVVAAPLPAAIAAVLAPANGNGGPVPTFGDIAREWAEHDQAITPKALKRKRDHVAKFARLHTLPITAISVQQCREVASQIRKDAAPKKGGHAVSGLHTAQRAGSYLSQIFRFATDHHGIAHNPAAGHANWWGRSDNKALKARRHKHTTDPAAFGAMMSTIDMWEPRVAKQQGHGTSATSQNFLRLIARVPLRANEMAGARWSEFRHLDDPANALWVIPAERMKQRKEHEVPLSRQACAILLAQREYVRQNYPRGSAYVFPQREDSTRHIQSDNQARLLTTLGIKGQSIHGFRHSFETMTAKARGPEAAFLAHLCTAHEIDGVMGRYVVTDMPEHRRELFQWWADRIDALVKAHETGAPLPAAR